MKRLRVFLLFSLSILIFSFSSIKVFGEENSLGSSYVEDSIIEENALPYGVNHKKIAGLTSTSLKIDVDGLGELNDLVTPGKLYEQKINLLEIPNSTNIKVTTWANFVGHRWTLTTVRNLIKDYEAKNPGWKVIAAINADFFDINGNGNLPYQTTGPVVSNGEFYRTTVGYSMIGFRNDGSTESIVGNKVASRSSKMALAIYDENDNIIKEFIIDKVNEYPNDNESSVFFATYGSDKKIIPVDVKMDGYFVDQAELALPNSARDFYGKGVISSLNAKTISTGQFAIVSNNSEINKYLGLNVKVRVQFEYLGAYAGIKDLAGCNPVLMYDGKVLESGLRADVMTARHPRTVIGRKADGTIIMMVIDGRQASKGMYGVDGTEISAIMQHYGAVDVYNLDGGGSSTMIIKKDGEFVVMNSPSDGRERTDANALLVVAKDPEIQVETSSITTDSISLDVNILNAKDHDIQELYVVLNNEKKKVENKQVTFTNLKSNTKYIYSLEYKNKEGEFIKILTSGNVTTYKIMPRLNGFKILEGVSKYQIILDIFDPDNASSLDSAELNINGITVGFFNDGIKNIPKTFLNEITGPIVFTASYNIGDGERKTIVLEFNDYQIITSVEIYLYEIYIMQSEKITNFYK